MKKDGKTYAMKRMGSALSRAVASTSIVGKDRAARWAAAWGMLAGITVREKARLTLDLDDQARKRMRALQVLEVDGDGDEVFVGLTAAESAFYLDKSRLPKCDLTASETWLYQQIKDRHIRARLQIINDEVRLYLVRKQPAERG